MRVRGREIKRENGAPRRLFLSGGERWTLGGDGDGIGSDDDEEEDDDSSGGDDDTSGNHDDSSRSDEGGV